MGLFYVNIYTSSFRQRIRITLLSVRLVNVVIRKNDVQHLISGTKFVMTLVQYTCPDCYPYQGIVMASVVFSNNANKKNVSAIQPYLAFIWQFDPDDHHNTMHFMIIFVVL